MERLTDKQKRFCQEYVVDLNATQAAIRSGYSAGSARVTAARMLTKANILKEIRMLQSEISDRNKVTVDYLIKELKGIAEDDMSKYVESRVMKEGVRLSLNRSFPVLDKKNIRKIQFNKRGEVTIEMYSRLEALVQLGRHIGFFNDQLTIKNNLEEVLSGLHESGVITEEHLRQIAKIILEHQQKKMNSNGE